VTDRLFAPGINPALAWAGIFGLLAVAMGAYAAHGLRSVLAAAELATVQTAVQYQMWHALVLLVVAGLPPGRARALATLFFVTGIFGFSGSLYILVFTELRPGLMTPLGGLLLMAGWLTLLLAGLVRKRANPH
jgi:uncharacterized membrane protein YgdD (TMEM256/DUF423 family)